MKTSEVVRCPDGHFCRVIYELGPYIADYPEQTLATEVVQEWCPCCLKDRRNLGDPKEDLCRCRKHTKELVLRLDPKVLWNDYGVIADVLVSVFPSHSLHVLLIHMFPAIYIRVPSR